MKVKHHFRSSSVMIVVFCSLFYLQLSLPAVNVICWLVQLLQLSLFTENMTCVRRQKKGGREGGGGWSDWGASVWLLLNYQQAEEVLKKSFSSGSHSNVTTRVYHSIFLLFYKNIWTNWQLYCLFGPTWILGSTSSSSWGHSSSSQLVPLPSMLKATTTTNK